VTGVSPEALKANECNNSSSRTQTIKEVVPEKLVCSPFHHLTGPLTRKKFYWSVDFFVVYGKCTLFPLPDFLSHIFPLWSMAKNSHSFCIYTQVNKISLSSLRKTIGFETEYRNSIQTKCQTCRYMTLTAVLMWWHQVF